MDREKQREKARERRQSRVLLTFALILLIWGIMVSLFTIVVIVEFKEEWFGLSIEKYSASENDMFSNGLFKGEESEVQKKCKSIYEKKQALLVLVNKEHGVPEDYTVDLRDISGGRLQVAEVLYEDLTQMLADADEQAGYEYYFQSGYRDAEYQRRLLEQDVASFISQYGYTREEAMEKALEETNPPGHSEHETGLAIDITAAGYGPLDETQAARPEIKWLHENSWKYGFVLRYPKDKENITQIGYEPWHFRYVGKEAATFLHEEGMTLEEFYEYL